MNHRRSEIDILRDLLSAAQQDIKKTRLMYKLNMSHFQFTKYLEYLLDKGVVAEKNSESNGKLFSLTDKGRILLTSLDNVYEYLK